MAANALYLQSSCPNGARLSSSRCGRHVGISVSINSRNRWLWRRSSTCAGAAARKLTGTRSQIQFCAALHGRSFRR
jgi:hypothetical protein